MMPCGPAYTYPPDKGVDDGSTEGEGTAPLGSAMPRDTTAVLGSWVTPSTVRLP
jgi:hypothetical protein